MKLSRRLDHILIDEWRKAWKYISVQIPAIGMMLYGIWFIFPSLLPPKYVMVIGGFIFLGTIIARIFPQPKVVESDQDAKSNK